MLVYQSYLDKEGVMPGQDRFFYSAPARVFDGGAPDPSVELCLEASAWLAEQPGATTVDHLIALGGGSNIDLAKVLSVTLRYGGHPASYVDEGRLPGSRCRSSPYRRPPAASHSADQGFPVTARRACLSGDRE